MWPALLLACAPTPSASPADSGTPAPCAVGEHRDGSACVPEACGTGPWGAVPVDAETVYVILGGTGDGTEAAPLGSIQEAMDLAGGRGGGRVVVAAGTYPEALSLTEAHDGVTLTGRCRELVTLDAGEAGEVPSVWIVGDARRRLGVTVEGLTLRAGRYVGLWVEAASVRVVDADLRDHQVLGVLAVDADVEMERVGVYGTVPGPDGAYGRGLDAEEGSVLRCTDCTIEGNRDVGVYATHVSTEVELLGGVVRGTLPGPDGTWGWGISSWGGATVRAVGTVVEANTQLGVFAAESGTRVELEDAVVAGTLPTPGGADGRGIQIQDAATFTAVRTDIVENVEIGLIALGAGTRVDLTDGTVARTRPTPTGRRGWGVAAVDGASVSGVGLGVEDNTEVGVFTHGLGTQVELEDARVVATRRSADTASALGVMAQDAGAVVLVGGTVSDTEGPGLYAVGAGVFSGTSTSVLDNQFAGVVVLDAGSVTLDEVTVTGTTADPEWGGGFGVYAADTFGPPTLTLRDATIGPHPYAAVWLDGDGTYRLERNDLSGGPPFALNGISVHGNALFAERGVRAWDGERGLWISGDHLHGSEGVALHLDGASARVDGATFASNGVDVWQQRCEDIPPLSPTEAGWVVCDGGALLTDFAIRLTNLYLAAAKPLE